MTYAQNTKVPVSRSRAELLRILEAHGCDDIVQGGSARRQMAVIQFHYENIPCRIALRLPSPQEERFHLHGSGWQLSPGEAERKYDKELRRIWRCLVLMVKARFEELDANLFSPQQTLASWMLLPNGTSIGEALDAGGETLLAQLVKTGAGKLLTWEGKKT